MQFLRIKCFFSILSKHRLSLQTIKHESLPGIPLHKYDVIPPATAARAMIPVIDAFRFISMIYHAAWKIDEVKLHTDRKDIKNQKLVPMSNSYSSEIIAK